MYCGNVDAASKSASIANKNNLKAQLSLQIYRAFKKHGYFGANQIFVQFYLLRPKWLSLMGISSIICDLTGISLRNPTSISFLAEKLNGKEIVLREKAQNKCSGDTELHDACR